MDIEKIVCQISYTEGQTEFKGVNHAKSKDEIVHGKEGTERKCGLGFKVRKHPYRFSLEDIQNLETVCRPLLETDPILSVFAEKWRFHGEPDIFARLNRLASKLGDSCAQFIATQTDVSLELIKLYVTGASIDLFLAVPGVFLIEIVPHISGYNSDLYYGSIFKGVTVIPAPLYQKGGGEYVKKLNEMVPCATIVLLERMEALLVQRGVKITPDTLFSPDLQDEVLKEWDNGYELWKITDPRYQTIFLGTFAMALGSQSGPLLHSFVQGKEQN